VFSIFNFAQQERNLNKWLNIKPFVSTREDIEKIYGDGEEFALGKLYQTSYGNVGFAF
jgi:hypothetical protein